MAAEAVIASRRAHRLGDRLVYGREIAVFGMKFAADPPTHDFVLVVAGIAPCFEELGIAVRPADVLWWP